MPVNLKTPEIFGDVKVEGGYTGEPFITDAVTFVKAKLIVSGDTVVLAVRDIRKPDADDEFDAGSKRFKSFDRIVDAQGEELPNRRMMFTGISEKLSGEPYNLRGEDAQVRWTLLRTRCETC